MNIQIRAHDVTLTKGQRSDAARELEFRLARFGDRIARVILRFSDANGHRGGIDKRCQIDIGMRGGHVRVEHTDVNLLVALAHASHQAARAVAREIERKRLWVEHAPAA